MPNQIGAILRLLSKEAESDSSSSWRKTTANIFSSYLTNWIGLFYFIAVIHPPKIIKGEEKNENGQKFFNPKIQFMRFYLIWSLPYTIAMIVKPLIAQGRPFYYCSGVQAWSCSCSYGMPSSHSCTGVSVYFTLYSIINTNLPQNKWSFSRAILAFFCSFFAIGIAFSRAILGSHTFMQILIGFFLGVLGVLFLSKEFFEFFLKKKILEKSWIGQTLFLASYWISVIFIAMLGYYLNKGDNRIKENWIKRDECPRCLDSLVYKQMDNNTHFLLTGGYLLGTVFNYNFLRKNPEENKREKRSTFWVYLIRSLTMLTAVGVLGIGYFVLGKIGDFKSNGVYRFYGFGLLLSTFGFVSMYAMPLLWKAIGCDLGDRDFVYEK